MQQLFIAGLGGFVGSACRYAMSALVSRTIGQNFPYGTLFVNVLGSLLIGILMTLFEEGVWRNSDLRIFLIIGILGGFTTFSAFSFENVSLLKQGSFFLAAANILCSLIACLSATWIGGKIGKLV